MGPLALSLLLAFGVALPLGWISLTVRRVIRTGRAEAAAARRAEAEAVRLLRLGAMELRHHGLALLGHAERLRLTPLAPTGEEVASIGAYLLTLADDMQDHAAPTAESRVLTLEPLAVQPLLDSAISTVVTALGPDSRVWNIDPNLSDLRLTADRRALVQILTRVLAHAARTTRHQDWIELSLERSETALTLVVQDEGSGLASPDAATGVRFDSRGLGLGLSLARALMQAHGGQLVIEAAPGIGTRVALTFPVKAVLPELAA